MKILFNLFLGLFIISITAFGQSTKRVLFLGNSYTDVNNLPSIIADLALNTGDTLIYTKHTPGGQTLEGHHADAQVLSFIQQGGWDYMVMQEQSQRPSFPISQVSVEVFPYAQALSDSLRMYNPCATPMFFMTWGRENGDNSNCAVWPPVCSYNGMDSLLNLRYRMMGDLNDAYVSPVGAVWHYIRDNFAQIDLYQSDESHPSLEGSYAAACTFYALIYQKDPTLITNDYNLDPTSAMRIRTAAKIIAFDSLAKWNVGKFVPQAAFTSNQTAPIINFTNQSIYANSYMWYFGDGDSSALFEPSHQYINAGLHHVILKAIKCELTDTVSHNVNIFIDAIDEQKTINAILFPNPVSSHLSIQFSQVYKVNKIALYSIDGKLVKEFEGGLFNTFELNMENIDSGVYFLQFEINNQNYQYKIIKSE